MEDEGSKLKGLVWLTIGCVVGAFLALGLAPLAHIIPWSWEKKLGDMLGDDALTQSCPRDVKAEAALQNMVKRLYPLQPDDAAFSINVKVVNSAEINAYATLGGVIYVNAGLLHQAKSSDEIAGVVAHEIGHVHHRDIMQGFLTHMLTTEGMRMIFGTNSSGASWAGYFISMEFGRSQESAADEDGLQRLQKAHISNSGLKDFMKRMEKMETVPAFISDHPSDSDRMAMIDTFENKNTTPPLSDEEWASLKGYCSK